MSWSAWSAQQTHETEATVTEGPLPSTFCVSGDGWLVGRQPLELDEARAWLTNAQEIAEGSHDGRLPAIGAIPELQVSFSPPNAVIRAMPKADAAVGSLLSGADRPAEGTLWRSPRQPVALELPPTVDVETATACWPPRAAERQRRGGRSMPGDGLVARRDALLIAIRAHGAPDRRSGAAPRRAARSRLCRRVHSP